MSKLMIAKIAMKWLLTWSICRLKKYLKCYCLGNIYIDLPVVSTVTTIFKYTICKVNKWQWIGENCNFSKFWYDEKGH